MNWIDRLIARRRLHRDLDEEIQAHLDEKIEDLIDAGLTRDEARHAARRAFGNITLTTEAARDALGWPTVEAFWSDVRYAFRQLRRNPSVSLVAVVSSALGIGASTAVFCVLYAVIINPYPYRDPGRLVHLHVFDRGSFLFDLPLSSQQFDEFRRSPVLADAMAMDVEGMAETGGNLPESINAGFLSPNAFAFLGVPPLLGEVFTEAVGQPGTSAANGARPAVLSYGYWQSHLDGDPAIIGRTLQLNHQDYTVVGVMPRRFAWWNCDVYLPLARSPDPDRLASVFARLKPEVSDEAARESLDALIRHLAPLRANRFPATFEIRLLHMNTLAAGALGGILTVAGIAVGLLLLIGCANVSILLLARGTTRTHELAVRVALGASRRRILGQLLTESLLISIAGGALGILLAHGAVDLMAWLLPAGTFPPESVIAVSLPVLLFCTAIAMVTGILFGMWPAVHFSHPELTAGLQKGGRWPSGYRGHTALIAGQVALTLVLLAGAAATSRAFERLLDTPLAYDPQGVTSVRIDLRDHTYTQWDDRARYYDRILRSISGAPGIVSAALSLTDLPPSTPFRTSTIEMPDRPIDDHQMVFLSEVSAEYFSTLRIPLIRGGTWSAADTERPMPVAVVNAALAERYWPGANPIGRLIHLAGLKAMTSWATAAPDNDGWVEVVGVAANTPNAGLNDPAAPLVYVPYTLVIGDSLRLITRTTGDPLVTLRAIRERVHTIDPDQPISQVWTASDLLDAQGWARQRLTASIFGAFALLGVLLSAAGLYSVVSYVVSQRTQEFGVRIALGARRWDVARLVLGSAIEPALTGIAIGLVLCALVNAALVRWTDATLRDPYVIMPVVAMLLVVAALAALVPAYRAASTPPMNVLRAE